MNDVGRLIRADEMAIFVDFPQHYIPKPIARYEMTARGELRCCGETYVPFPAQYLAARIAQQVPAKLIAAEPLVLEVIPLSPTWSWIADKFALPPKAPEMIMDTNFFARIDRFRQQVIGAN